MKALNRRNFLRSGTLSVAGLASASSLSPIFAQTGTSESKNVLKRKLGNTGLEIPVVSMGVGRCDSPAVVKGAMKLGINHFDTAHIYQQGNSEIMLGEVLKDYPRDSFTIATKVKISDSKEKFAENLDISLERLKMDYVDILYLHSCTSEDDVKNPVMIEALTTAVQQGKAKYIGLSTHKNEPEVIKAAIESKVYNVVLTAYNFKQEHTLELQEKISEAAAAGIGIVAMKVMAGGFLDKEKTVEVNYPAALKWALQNKGVTTTIPSMVNLEQLLQNSEILNSIELTDEEKQIIAQTRHHEGMYCDGCSSCIDRCTKKLPIPEYMRAYMYNYGYGESKKAKELVAAQQLKSLPCSDCIECQTSCKKGFNISQKINNISRIQNIENDFLS